jgi:hypothetical protein
MLITSQIDARASLGDVICTVSACILHRSDVSTTDGHFLQPLETALAPNRTPGYVLTSIEDI